MNLNLNKLEKKINIKFKNIKLLTKSLTHKSYDSINNNEKLEFLGDRVLGLIISKKLLEIYPDDQEVVLDKQNFIVVTPYKDYEWKITDIEDTILGHKVKKLLVMIKASK